MDREIRAVIVDDEPPARRRIRSLLDTESDIEVVAECKDGREAIATIEAVRPELIFLDVQMPEADGFDVVDAIGADRMPTVIFVTAYDEFAVRAFEVYALDYLLKPFDRDRFRIAVQRAREQIRQQNARDLEPRLLDLLSDLRRQRFLERLPVKSGGKIRFVNVDEIDYISAESNYARLHVGKRSYLVRETLLGLESRLNPDQFIRIHRSLIVRMDRVEEMEPVFQGEYSVVLRDGTRLRSGRSYRSKLREVFNLS